MQAGEGVQAGLILAEKKQGRDPQGRDTQGIWLLRRLILSDDSEGSAGSFDASRRRCFT